jgi:hypothetical protein
MVAFPAYSPFREKEQHPGCPFPRYTYLLLRQSQLEMTSIRAYFSGCLSNSSLSSAEQK